MTCAFAKPRSSRRRRDANSRPFGFGATSYSTVASRETLAFPAWIAGECFTEAFSKPLRRINDDVAPHGSALSAGSTQRVWQLVLSLGLALSIGSALARTGADTALDIAMRRNPPPRSGDYRTPTVLGCCPNHRRLRRWDSARLFAEGKLACRSLRDAFWHRAGGRRRAEGRSNCISTLIRPEYFWIAPRCCSACRTIPQQDQLHHIGVT